MEINYEISQCNQILPIDPVFSNWVNVNKKVSITNCPVNSKSFKAIFLFEIQKLKILKKKRVSFCFSFIGFITLFQLSVGYVCFNGLPAKTLLLSRIDSLYEAT